eukprot:7257722-Prymnesium_polylepis.1
MRARYVDSERVHDDVCEGGFTQTHMSEPLGANIVAECFGGSNGDFIRWVSSIFIKEKESAAYDLS